MTTDADWYHIPKQSLPGITPTLELVKLTLDCDRVGLIYQSHGIFSFYDHFGVSHPVNKNEIDPLLISGLLCQPETVSAIELQQTDYPCGRILPLQDIDNKLYGLLVVATSTATQDLDQPIVYHAQGVLRKQLIAGLRSVTMESINYRVILDNMPVMIAHVGPDNIFIFGNRTYQDYFHIHGEKLIGLNIEEAVDLNAHPQYKQAMDTVRQGKVTHFERSVHVMREKKTLAITFIPGELGGDFYIFSQDVTPHKLSHKALEHKAFHDILTGLPNRAYFERAIQDAMACQNFISALLFIDIDSLKHTNDLHGHLVGDQLIQKFAQLLSDTIDASAIAFRYAGDEFVVLMQKLEQPMDQIEHACQSLINNLPVIYHNPQGEEISAQFSIGATLIDPLKNPSWEHWLRQADNAMYQAKQTGKGNYIISPIS